MEGERAGHSLHFSVITGVLAVGWFALGRAESATLGSSLRLVIVVLAVANLAWAVTRVRTASVRVVSQPTRLFVGDDAGVGIAVTRCRGSLRMRMASSKNAPWVMTDGDATGTLPGPADFRGIANTVVVQVRSDGPLGIGGYSRLLRIPLRPIYIGPRPKAPDRATELRSGAARMLSEATATTDVLSSIRDYRAGDPLRRISWPATARAGQLMSRDLERGSDHELLLVVDLGPTPGEAAEHAASLAAWVGRWALDRGWQLQLAVRGPEGESSDRVDADALHCNLAVAACGPVTLPAGRPFLLITPAGVEWR